MASATPETVSVTQIDFSLTPLSKSYTSFYAKVIDGLFTADDCARIQAITEDKAHCPDGWLPAGMNDHNGTKTVHSDFRNSDRALAWDEATANFIYDKLRPYVEELHEIQPDGDWASITGKKGKKQGPTWVLSRINERLSFLRYGPGHYFKLHCDGLNEFEGRKSFATMHLYLNDSVEANRPLSECSGIVPPDSVTPSSVPLPGAKRGAPSYQIATAAIEPCDEGQESEPSKPLAGGSTRFWSTDKKAFIDIFPKLGRVLIFQQRMLLHSGEMVTNGIKYTVRSDFMFEQSGNS